MTTINLVPQQSPMIAKVDNACVGCGLCEDACPRVFQMGDDNLVHILARPVPAKLLNMAMQAAEGCPINAIQLAPE